MNVIVKDYLNNDTSLPLIFVLPAMGVKARFYEPFAHELNTKGYAVVVLEWRGNGEHKQKPSRQFDFGYKELLDDINSAVKAYEERCPLAKKIIFGHSLGGQLGSLFAAQNPTKIDTLVLITSCSIYFKGWDGLERFKVLLASYLFPLIATVLGYFPGDKFKFAGKEAKTVIYDWSKTIRSGRYQPKGSLFDYEKAMMAFSKQVLAFSVENDELATFKAVNNLLGKFLSQPEIEHIVLTSNNTGVEKLNHFNWVKKPNYVVQRFVEWHGEMIGK